tara:strand:+ start:664 stop:1407 length:744 start_codon:yes stop_codon:yes gene_type:complete
MRNLLKKRDVLDTYKSEYHGKKALSNYQNWFPLQASQALAGIIADLMGDGHLQDSPKLRLDYTSKSITELRRFNHEMFGLFGIKGKIRKCTTNLSNSSNFGINNKPLARTLKLLGVPTGAKVLKDFKIPSWILRDKQFFARFVNRLFSCEGCVDTQSKCLEIKMYKNVALIQEGMEFFETIKFYLDKHFNIKSTNPFLEGRTNLRKDGIKTKGVRLKIKNKFSLIKFQKYVGIEDPNKKEKLKGILN